MTDKQQIALAITGASGAPYSKRLLEVLLERGITVHLMVSAAGRIVLADELDWKLPARSSDVHKMLVAEFQCDAELLQVYGEQQWSSPLASGSHRINTMIICPCTMGTLSSIACGSSDNLINRAADVMIKENRKLIIVPREAPFSAIHLENMLKLARLGVSVLPPNPGFYFKPKTLSDIVDFVVARILDQANIEHQLLPRWGE
ncbi:MAG: aromatic acid decarboxylase [Gammaproteobacteria bacterium]|nr:MAG: aromatic acid decarboxylase [Gammaproteobacteria bacterium]RKZ96286.1 MAG: aromatic acid decarboxylase [Gammaproteobacteria bacterium]RKZ98201.1 MAG: aromatic acid decarboxylase [Gammaproteobacteria bacterium]RLA01065.1 MAG: aromatic acid decarboxylase [Gammaproteobacteria bacterium]HHA18144.1 UbiX family flavin prenyltransferase [Methylophaga sp.]